MALIAQDWPLSLPLGQECVYGTASLDTADFR